MQLRIGLPLTGGYLVRAARAHAIPVLFSANAFVRRDEQGVPSIRPPRAGAYDGLDVALDSAGFVAMSRYRGYDWTVRQYLALVASQAWTWWAQMDCCVEPEIAGDPVTRAFRIAETARLFGECARAASAHGLSAPMPVLQGWTPDDYRRSAALLPVWRWPELVGVGSVCRRDVHGPQGLVRVIETLDRELPAHVKLHLFGVKGSALDLIGQHPRVYSVDSMAWDMAARRRWPTGRTMQRRASAMLDWKAAQIARCAKPFPGTQSALALETEDEATLDPALADWLSLVATDHIEMDSAHAHYARGLHAETSLLDEETEVAADALDEPLADAA
jgi:hypothetical protein